MNVFQLISDSATKGHGRELTKEQIKELVTATQGMYWQLADTQARLDALTRILTVALNNLGGNLSMKTELFDSAEQYAVDVKWDDEGNEIYATIRLADVDLPSVQEDGEGEPRSDEDAVRLQESEDRGEADADDVDRDEEE